MYCHANEGKIFRSTRDWITSTLFSDVLWQRERMAWSVMLPKKMKTGLAMKHPHKPNSGVSQWLNSSLFTKTHILIWHFLSPISDAVHKTFIFLVFLSCFAEKMSKKFLYQLDGIVHQKICNLPKLKLD